MPSRSGLRWTATLAIPFSLSCVDAATSPSDESLSPPGTPTRAVGTLQGPIAIPIPDTNLGGGAVDWTATGFSVPAWTSYLVRIEGRTTVTSNPLAKECNPSLVPPYGSEGSYGPSGDRYYYLKAYPGWLTSGGVGTIGMVYDGYDTSGGSEAHTDTLFTWDGGQLVMSRSGIAGGTNGNNPPGCQAGLYALSASQTISLETFDDQELTVTPSWIAVKKGTAVSFKATSRGVLVDYPHWRFDADPGVTNQTSACGTSGPNPCVVTVQNSGTLRVAKNTQGRMRSAVAKVKVYTSFALDADKTELVSGDTVTFTPKLDGVTNKVARWLWRGDDSSVVAAPCATDTDTCVQTPRRSGTMWAYTAATGGDSASKHVTVSPPTLTLTASKYTLEAPGENDTFTATANGRLVVLGWSFTADGGSMDRLEMPSSSSMIRSASPHGSAGTAADAGRLFGARTAVPRHNVVSPQPNSGKLAVPAGSRRLASQGSSWGGCSPWSTQCTNFVSESGTVDILAAVNGDTLRVSVHVTVVPCPTHDPNLDSPVVRSKLDSIWKLARPDTTKIDSFRERAISGYDSSGTLVVRILQFDTASTPCKNLIIDPTPPPGIKVFDMHVHPFAPNDSLPRACNDTSYHLKPNQFLRYGHTWGGLSDADWNHTALTPSYPVYTFDRDSVYKGRPGANMPYDPVLKKYLPTNWQQFYESWPRRGPGCEIVRY